MRFISPPIILFIVQRGQRWVCHWVQGQKMEDGRDLKPCDLLTFSLYQNEIRPLSQAAFMAADITLALIPRTIITNGLQLGIFINPFHFSSLQRHSSRREQTPETEDEDSVDLLRLSFTSGLRSAWIVQKKNSSGRKKNLI